MSGMKDEESTNQLIRGEIPSVVYEDDEYFYDHYTNQSPISSDQECKQPPKMTTVTPVANRFPLESTTEYINTNISDLQRLRLNLSPSPSPLPTPILLASPLKLSSPFKPSRDPFESPPPRRDTRRDVSESTHFIQGGISIPIGQAFQKNDTNGRITDHDHEVDLLLFKHLLDTNLPHSRKSIHFKGIVLQYMEILHENDMNPGSDQMIITIYNQLKYHKPTDRSKLTKIVNVFLMEPSNKFERLANLLYFKGHKLKSGCFIQWFESTTNIIALNGLLKDTERFLRVKCFAKFIDKFDMIKDVYEPNADFYHGRSTIKLFFGIWKARLEEIRSYEECADQLVLGISFNQWKNRIVNDYKAAENLYLKNLSNSSLKNWRLNYRLKSEQSKKNTNLSLTKKREFLRIWKRSKQRVDTLEKESRLLELALHGGFVFSKWKRQAQQTTKLSDILKKHILAKYLKLWISSLDLKLVENNVILKREELLKRFIMDKMKLNLKHDSNLEIFERKQRTKSLRKFMNRWKDQLMLNAKLVQHTKENHRLRLKFIKIWKVQTNLKTYEFNKDTELMLDALYHWKKSAALKIHEANFTTEHIIGKSYDKWISKSAQFQALINLSEDASKLYTQAAYLNNWKTSVIKNHQLEDRADLFVKKRFFGKFLKKIEHIEQLYDVSNEHYKSNQIILKTYFNRWHHHHQHNIERRLSERLKEFNRLSDSNLRYMALQSWKDKYSVYLLKEDDFINLRRPYYLRSVFDQWLTKKEYYEKLENESDRFNEIHLLSSGINKFKAKMYNVLYLQDLLYDYEEERLSRLLMKYFNDWNLKVLKNKSYNQTIQNFHNRWNRANLRAILSLWKNKADKTTMEMLQEEEDSPIKRKSLLSTPTKQSPGFLLGQSGGTIPRSERIKRYRMESLKNHYGKIKFAIPSPTSAFKNVSPVRKERPYLNGFGNLPKPTLNLPTLSEPLEKFKSEEFDPDSETVTQSEFGDIEEEFETENDDSILASPMIRRGLNERRGI